MYSIAACIRSNRHYGNMRAIGTSLVCPAMAGPLNLIVLIYLNCIVSQLLMNTDS